VYIYEAIIDATSWRNDRHVYAVIQKSKPDIWMLDHKPR